MSDHSDVWERSIGEPELGGFFVCFFSLGLERGYVEWFHCCLLQQLQLVFSLGIEVGSVLFLPLHV